ncbi:hypothetical protein BKA56DRAFT_667431 [Ilyonectria sp. MPI-CAGE-AT-0026]|nr:hypothetical protein BKA56DRAFT_667431 [Ilyonectria sp. MPI-CAGE-AT-0026]
MPNSKTVRSPVKRTLKPAPPSQSHVHSPTSKSEVQFALPGTVPTPESIQIRTIAVPQPFLEPAALKRQ